jgi:NAD(P)-dependent dehydrogenase (short-subunit alcohol dehydrogenase family)
MDWNARVVVITGAGGGIGAALAHAFAAEGARVVVSDRDADAANAVANAIDGTAIPADAGVAADITALVHRAEAEVGPIALMASNAGILAQDPDQASAASAPDAEWDRSWRVNVMAHVWAARAALPAMIARREGWFLQTVSAAGLLNIIGAAPYAATKAAALAFAESLAITHRDHCIRVSALCPQAVETAMIHGHDHMGGADVDGILSADEVAASALAGLAEGRFLILPHPRVAEYRANKAADYERWIGGMAKFRRGLLAKRTLSI